MGRPSQKTFEKMITSGKLLNNSVTVQDSRNAIKNLWDRFRSFKRKNNQKENRTCVF
jgi:hypothetical protein